MSLVDVCDAIAAVSGETTHESIADTVKQCESHLGSASEVLDAVENSLSISDGPQRLMLWFLVDRLAKQHPLFLEALRPKMILLASHYAPRVASPEWSDFVALLKSSISVMFGAPLVSLILMQLEGGGGAAAERPATTRAVGTGSVPTSAGRSKRALTVHSTALRSSGAFMTKAVAVNRPAAQRHTLQVKTIDSQMSMNVASRYAPAKPVEVMVPDRRPDADAPRGYMQALPADYYKTYEDKRRKRLREIMEHSREEQDRQQEQQLLEKVRSAGAAERAALTTHTDGDSAAGTSLVQAPDYSDIQMPAEFPRDEYGVKRGNFPLGVRFLKEAVRACGGAVELDVIVNRISTLASKEAVAEFGNVREFLLIHGPTFRLQLEKNTWIVRLTDERDSDDTTWEVMECPGCSKRVKGRNLARHLNCRQCITAQIARGLQGDYMDRGPVAELAHMAKQIINRRDAYDDGDVDDFTECLKLACEMRRFRLASPRQFAPILKAIRIIRDRWLGAKGVEEVQDAAVDTTDASVVNLFRTLGAGVHRLPIPWIETGDVIDMCRRFSESVLPPFNPPPRPADPRINLNNEYPGFLLCESEVDDEDKPSGDDDEFSDDEAPAFTFAPPVDMAESLFTAGFEKDTQRLQHRMRTAPPMVLQRVLQGDRTQTHSEMYTDTHTTARSPSNRRGGNMQRV